MDMPSVRPIFLIKIVSAVFEIFRKKEAKNPLFSCTITILDHTLYGKVKKLITKKFFLIKNNPQFPFYVLFVVVDNERIIFIIFS